MSRTFCRENKDKKVEQQGRETEITWEGAWEGRNQCIYIRNISGY